VSKLFMDLNESQRQAVTHVDGPLLVLAGAGSGKTRVITRRVAYLAEQGISPHHILAITFTNKAAGEMRDRVAELACPPGATICTFHSLCARLLRDYADLAGLSPNYSIYDRDDQLKVAKRAIEEANIAGSNFTPARVHGQISNLKNELKVPADVLDDGDRYIRNVAKVYGRYEKILAANNALDFDDLLMKMSFLMRQQPDVRDALGRRFQYVLIDEYQDTNHAQYILAHGIALDHENICATGDPDQSIYAWRGADINNILDFEKDYPDATVVRLEENYRSVQPILTAASTLIAHNRMRKSKNLFTRKEGGEAVGVLICDDEHAEAREIANRIDAYRNDGGAYGDVAVFYRVNSLSRVLEEALMKKGVPYRIARGTEFYNRKEIKDMLAYCKLLVNPADDVSCLRIINTPSRGIGQTSQDRLASYAAPAGLCILDATAHAEAAGVGGASLKKVNAFAAMMHELAADIDRADASVSKTLEDIFRRTGLEESLSGSDEDARQARANIEELISTAAEFDEQDHEDSEVGPLAAYLHQVALVSDVDRLEGATGAVTFMTLHAAKGLEFPVVFMVGCEEGLLPFQRGPSFPGMDEDIEKTEEERRLAFVGMTRSQTRLAMSCAKSRMVRGRRTPQAKSRFLDELGAETVRVEDLTTSMAELDRSGGFRNRMKRARGGRRRGGFYDEASQREIIEAMDDRLFEDGHRDDVDEPVPPEYAYLKPGCMVRHATFGTGKVVKLSQPWPKTRATVLFHEFGQKKLVLAHTSLDVLESENW
jgi:DNA helicase-2/ATP-dependent DNA helicase PcrA